MIFSLMALFLSCSKNNVSSNDQNISDLLDCGIDTTFSLPLPAVDIARYSDCRYILAGIYGTEILDELGNTTTISPHNFELIPEGASEEMAWSHHSVKGNKTVNVDMMKLARLVEELTGEKLVYTEET